MTNKIFRISLFFFACAAIHGSVWAGEEKTVISYLQGNGVIVRGGREIPASVGASCQKNDVLKTGPACTLDISMNGLAGCRLLASSECLITDDGQDMNLQLAKGNAVMNLNKIPKGSSFRVETPTAIAAVRGTQFWGRVDSQNPENPVTTFAVRQGSVDIWTKTAGLKLSITEGQALDIPKDPSVVPSLRRATAGELEAMEQADAIKTSA